MTDQITPPTPPASVEWVNVESIPDEPCDWRDDNEWESGNHGGYRCDKCGELSECIYCEPNQPNVECGRNRARNENRRRERDHVRVVQDYEAQVRYYVRIIGGAAMTDHSPGGAIPGTRIQLDVTECVISPGAARDRTWRCSRLDAAHLDLIHNRQPNQPAALQEQHMTEQTAYVVTQGGYSDYHVERVYLDREKAHAYVDAYNRTQPLDEMQVEEYPIGVPPDIGFEGPGFEGKWWPHARAERVHHPRMTDNVERHGQQEVPHGIEQHLAAHEYLDILDGWDACECGWREEYERRSETGTIFTHHAHVAATWREARTVRTIDELDALPVGTVIRDVDGAMYRRSPYSVDDDGRWYPAWTVGNAYERDMGVESREIPTPGLIVWTPEEDV